MVRIYYTKEANRQIDDIVLDKRCYDKYGHFTQNFLNWNSEFHAYVNYKTINNKGINKVGVYAIGNIGTLQYRIFNISNYTIFEIIEFRFSKLPYKQKKINYSIINKNIGNGYKIAKSLSNNKLALFNPKHKQLTKFEFDTISNLKQSKNNPNEIYAIGNKGNNKYKITLDGKQSLIENKNHFIVEKSEFFNLLRESVSNAFKDLFLS